LATGGSRRGRSELTGAPQAKVGVPENTPLVGSAKGMGVGPTRVFACQMGVGEKTGNPGKGGGTNLTRRGGGKEVQNGSLTGEKGGCVELGEKAKGRRRPEKGKRTSVR